jgi:hypothetical protein
MPHRLCSAGQAGFAEPSPKLITQLRRSVPFDDASRSAPHGQGEADIIPSLTICQPAEVLAKLGAKREDAMRRAAVLLAMALANSAQAADTRAIAVADFDYSDSSGEAVDQSAQHRARMAAFADLLHADLARRAFVVTQPACAAPPCTAGSMAPDELIAAARQGGARYLLYGRIHKMSTLAQGGVV